MNGRMGTGGTRGKLEYIGNGWSAGAQGNVRDPPFRILMLRSWRSGFDDRIVSYRPGSIL